jgi:hypothetical protein
VRYVVEFELHSDFGNRLGEAIREAISVLGSIDKLKMVPVTTYTLYIQGNRPQSAADIP